MNKGRSLNYKTVVCERIIGADPRTLKPIHCKKSMKTFERDKHKAKHENDELWCPICNKEMTDYNSFMKHVQLHDGIKLPKYSEYKFQCLY